MNSKFSIPQKSHQVWLITGSSSGLGRSLAQAALEKGYSVVATARQPEKLDKLALQYPQTLKTVRLEVTNPNEVRDVVATAISVFGRIDVLVNNAGYGLVGALEELSPEQIRHNFETMVFGSIAMMQGVLPIMRQQQSGHIVNISSIVGFSNRPGFSVYGGAKCALGAISEGLQAEVAPLGIRVTIVAPGPFRTDFFGRSLVQAQNSIAAYQSTSGKFRQYISQNQGSESGDPDKAAQVIIQVVESENPPLRIVLGKYAYRRFRQKLESLTKDLNTWEVVATSTDFED